MGFVQGKHYITMCLSPCSVLEVKETRSDVNQKTIKFSGFVLIHLFQCIFSISPENIRKSYGFLMISGGRERLHWKQIG